MENQIAQNSDKPEIISKLQAKLTIAKEKLNNFLTENQTPLLASAVIGLTSIAGVQSIVNNNLQKQIDLNSDLNRLTDEKMLDTMETKAKRKEQEFNQKIQKLQQEMQELKKNQTSTLLPKTESQKNSPILPGYNDRPFQPNQDQFDPQIPQTSNLQPKEQAKTEMKMDEPQVTAPPAPIPMPIPNSPTEGN